MRETGKRKHNHPTIYHGFNDRPSLCVRFNFILSSRASFVTFKNTWDYDDDGLCVSGRRRDNLGDEVRCPSTLPHNLSLCVFLVLPFVPASVWWKSEYL